MFARCLESGQAGPRRQQLRNDYVFFQADNLHVMIRLLSRFGKAVEKVGFMVR